MKTYFKTELKVRMVVLLHSSPAPAIIWIMVELSGADYIYLQGGFSYYYI